MRGVRRGHQRRWHGGRCPSQATNWLSAHGLWSSDQSLDEKDFQRMLALRTALRDFVAIDPAMRSVASGALRRLEAAAASFPLTLCVGPAPPMLELRPRHAVGKVISELFGCSNSATWTGSKHVPRRIAAGSSSTAPSRPIDDGARRICAAIVRRCEPIDASIANRLKPGSP